MRATFRTRSLVLALTAACVAAVPACARNPVTGERELSLVSEEQEIQIGRQAAQEVEQTIGLVNEAALQAYVQRLGARLASESERPNLPWTFRVVDDPTPNAFALPGGFIFITRGLLNLLDTEAELATVLGHEIAHVTARHSVQQISRQQLAQLGLGIGSILAPDAAPLGQLAAGGLQLLFLKYGRSAENQADELGFRYALEAGYDVREMPDVFASLQRVSEASGQRSALPSWLATHPEPGERIERAQERIRALGADIERATLGRAEYLGQIDGLVYGPNPRNGFFESGVFYHPELRFRFAVPQGWQTQNLAQAVVAASPQNDAALSLTLASQQSAGAAAQAFLGTQGVQATAQPAQQSINGIPAVIVPFQAQTQQGVLAGYAAFIDYGGRTYQLLTYAPSGAVSRYDQLFRQVIGSFAPVSDPRILNVQPQRIDIVRLPRNMSLREFAQVYPSVVPLEELAILNQVIDPSLGLAAGTLLKRVVPGNA